MNIRDTEKEVKRGEPFVRRMNAAQEKSREVYAHRILEEWRANVQLYIHHDNLKQERIRHFLSMQGALLAFVGLSTKQAIEGPKSILPPITFLLFSAGISLIGFVLALAWRGMDDRARKFTLFERRCLRDLENQWNTLLPKDEKGLSTYTALAIVLEQGGEEFQNITTMRSDDIKQKYYGDYKILSAKKGLAASAREVHVFRAILFFWIASSLGHIALLVTFLILRHF